MVRLVFFSSSAISAGRTFNVNLSNLSCSAFNWAIAESFLVREILEHEKRNQRRPQNVHHKNGNDNCVRQVVFFIAREFQYATDYKQKTVCQ